jgi:hypothetical protein
MTISEQTSSSENNLICTKEELFCQISGALSYFHVLIIFKNSKHLALSKIDRAELMKAANNRLKELQLSGLLSSREQDPYFKVFC